MVGAKERNSANGRRAGAGERGIAVKPLEVVEGAFLELLEDERVILVRRARTELVPAMGNTSLEIRDDAEIGRASCRERV